MRRPIDIFVAACCLMAFGWFLLTVHQHWVKWPVAAPLWSDVRCESVLKKWIPNGTQGHIDIPPDKFRAMYQEMDQCMTAAIKRQSVETP